MGIGPGEGDGGHESDIKAKGVDYSVAGLGKDGSGEVGRAGLRQGRPLRWSDRPAREVSMMQWSTRRSGSGWADRWCGELQRTLEAKEKNCLP